MKSLETPLGYVTRINVRYRYVYEEPLECDISVSMSDIDVKHECSMGEIGESEKQLTFKEKSVTSNSSNFDSK